MNAVSSPPANSAEATDRETPDNTAVAETQERISTSPRGRPGLRWEVCQTINAPRRIRITGQ
jgi:hypothetical protein